MESIIVAIITGGITLIGVMIANSKSQAVTETKLEELTREVREVLPVVTSNGYFVENGALKENLSPDGAEALSVLDCAQYDMRRNFKEE